MLNQLLWAPVAVSDRAVSGSRTSRLKRRSTGVLVGTALVVASFVAYFVLIVYCDLNRPEAFGAKIRAASGGFVVETVEFASPASRGGLRPGDRLVAAAGQPLRGALDWNAAMARIEINRELSLEIEREGRRLASVVTFHPADARWWRSPEGMALLQFRVVQ